VKRTNILIWYYEGEVKRTNKFGYYVGVIKNNE